MRVFLSEMGSQILKIMRCRLEIPERGPIEGITDKSGYLGLRPTVDCFRGIHDDLDEAGQKRAVDTSGVQASEVQATCDRYRYQHIVRPPSHDVNFSTGEKRVARCRYHV